MPLTPEKGHILRKPKHQAGSLATKRSFSCKAVVLAALLCLLITFLLPLGLLLTGRIASPEGGADAEAAPLPSNLFPFASRTQEPVLSGPPEPGTRDGAVSITVLLNGKTRTMSLGEYLWGVVAAEMPASFDEEALRAQAVAARTYTLYRMADPSPNHPDAHICGDPGCCQAWMDYKERMADWGADASVYEEKVTKAVRSTDGMSLYYGGSPILAAFHAASAGSTKSAAEVWGEDYPYLQEVASPEDDALVPNYYSTLTLSAKKFAKVLKKAHPKADLSNPDCSKWFGKVKKDPAGLPVSIKIGGVKVPTVELRSLFELRSASMAIEGKDGQVTFYVTGYGHGVGMSQYGANALAKEGKTAEEILAWYYPGAELITASGRESGG